MLGPAYGYTCGDSGALVSGMRVCRAVVGQGSSVCVHAQGRVVATAPGGCSCSSFPLQGGGGCSGTDSREPCQLGSASVKTVGSLAWKAVGVKGHDEGCRGLLLFLPPGGVVPGKAPLVLRRAGLGERAIPVKCLLCFSTWPPLCSALVWVSEASLVRSGALTGSSSSGQSCSFIVFVVLFWGEVSIAAASSAILLTSPHSCLFKWVIL